MAPERSLDTRVVGALLRKELREAWRNRWFVLFSVLFAGLALALSGLGLAGLGRFGVSSFGRTAAGLLHLVMLIVPLMGLFLGALSIAMERDHGTLVTVLAQPVTPTEVLLGKFLGASSALGATILIGFGLSGLVIARHAGLAQMGDYVALVGFTLLLGWAHVGCGLLLSVLAPRGAVAVGLALIGWLALVILSDLGVMATAMVLRLSPGQLLWAAIGNPTQAFKLAVLQAMHGSLELLGPSGRYATEMLGAWLMPVMGGVLGAWLGGSVAAAWWAFRRRGAL